MADWMTKPCLLWAGARTSHGYGTVTVNGRTEKVHRRAWEQANGPIPAGMDVCHHCDVRHCFEPTHLFVGTRHDNMQDAKAKGRLDDRHGERNPQARLTADRAQEIRATVRALPPGVHPGGIHAAARKFGVSRRTIRRVLDGETWVRAALLASPVAPEEAE